MPDRQLKAELFDGFARIGKALSSGRRVEIVDILANGERTVEGLAKEAGLSIANASQHLQILRDAGLVTGRRNGTSVNYRLAPGVYQFWTALRGLAAGRLAEVERLVEAYLGPGDGLEPVSREELYRRLRSGEELVVLDVRPREEYAAGHVPGAVSIPLAELEHRLEQLPKERDVVVVPVGFVCDHVEVLYDLDVEAVATARAADLTLHRATAVNDHPRFIAVLADLVQRQLEGAR